MSIINIPDAGESSRSSSPLSSVPSSPLSSLASSPEPPPGLEFQLIRTSQQRDAPYPSPPASQQTSQTGSPVPDGTGSGTDADRDGQPPAKRRRISREPRERTTEHLDLRSGVVDPSQQEELERVLNVLHKRQKIVVIAGAGMSVSAGIPDFRSADGLFKTLKEAYKIKGSGKDLFDASVYKDEASTASFHSMVTGLYRSSKNAKPTAFHHMLATMAKEDRLLRLYSQNVDGLETALEPLHSSIPFCKDGNGKWPKTVQLHGGLEKMVCTKCHELYDFDVELFEEAGAVPPVCQFCETVNDIRTSDGKRSHGVGRLRPRMVLYNEQHPDAEAIGSVTQQDLRRRPDAVLVVGTSIKVPGVQRIVQEMCATVRDRKDGGLAIWINQDPPPTLKQFDKCFDIIVQGDCDEVARYAAMRKWDEMPEPDDYSEVSEEDAQKAAAKTAEVHLPRTPQKPKCQLAHADVVTLSTDAHYNNSFRPPPPDTTPKRDPEATAPGDWSPLTSQRSSIMQSIEVDGVGVGDDIVVADGLLTPTKSQKSTSRRSTPVKKVVSVNDKLKDTSSGKTRQPAALKGIGKAATSKSQKKSSVKYIKPRPSNSKKAPAKSRALLSSKSNVLTNAFTSTKATSVAAKGAPPKKLPSSAVKSPSKLNQVCNASNEPKHTSPTKKTPFFPGLAR